MHTTGLFLGLGNPGPTYEHTRHNFGFMLADALLAACRDGGDASSLSGGKNRYAAWKCRLPRSGSTWIVAKPLTYMNKSGEAAVHLLGYYRIPLSGLFVAHDELDLPLGRMRLKIGGGNAGHNGVQSICDLAGSPEFYRLRLGIGKPAGYDAASFVLNRFSAAEATLIKAVLPAALDGFLRFASQGPQDARQFINAFKPATE